MSAEERRQAVAEVGTWRHRIDVGDGVVTPGLEDCQAELARMKFPAHVSGQRVLDIGCSDGFYSFEAEARGAAEVVAIDDLSSLLNPDRRNGFEVARELRGSNVRFQARDVHDLNPETDGTFDLVLFINVLYHLRHPLLALDRIASVLRPGGVLVMKTFYSQDIRVWVRGRAVGFDLTRAPLMRFYEGTELAGDPTNWWGPNRRCVEAMLRSAGLTGEELLCRWRDRIYYRAEQPG